MPQEVTITIHRLSELDDDVQETLIDEYVDVLIKKDNWWRSEIGRILKIGKRMGIDLDRDGINFDLCSNTISLNGIYSYAKGSSAAIRKMTLDETVHEIVDSLTRSQSRRFYTVRVVLNSDGSRETTYSVTSRGEEVSAEVEPYSDIVSSLGNFASWAYKCLLEKYEDSTHRDVIRGTLETHHYFTRDGQIVTDVVKSLVL